MQVLRGGSPYNMREHGNMNRCVQKFSDSIPQLTELARIIGQSGAKWAKAKSSPNGRTYMAFTAEQVEFLNDIMQYIHAVSREHIIANKNLEEERRRSPWEAQDHRHWERDHRV
jgi:hypothetical protein